MTEEHQHKYVLMEVVYFRTVRRNRSDYERRERFFCETCLDEQEKIKRERDKEKPPEWFVTVGCETRNEIERW